MITLPPKKTGQWSQPNKSDISGSLWATNGIDLVENVGKIRLGKRLVLNTSSDDVNELSGVPVAFRSFGTHGYFWTAAGAGGTGYVFNTSVVALDGSFTKNAASGGVTAPSTIDSAYSDMEVLNGQLFVTTKTKAVYYLGNSEAAWGTFDLIPGSSTNEVHNLCVYAQRMYCTYNGNKIISWDNSASPSVASAGSSYTLDLGGDQSNSQIAWIRPSTNRIWIGILNKQGGIGLIHEWDGISSQVTKTYRLRSSGAISCVIVNDVPYVMDTLGNLLAWNGGTFVELTGLNVQNVRNLFNATGATNLRYIHPNGMSVIDGKLSVMIDGRNNDGAVAAPDTMTQLQAIPSGVYEYTPQTGLQHKHSVAYNKIASTITNYNQTRVKGAGAIAELVVIQSSQPQNGSFLVGASFSDDTSSSGGTKYGIFYDDMIDSKQKAGSFVTPKVRGEGEVDTFQNLYPHFKTLINSGDKMVFKYRTEDLDFTQATVKSPTSSTVTSLADLSAVQVGDEIEFVQGLNAGICCHITAISYNAGTTTYTFTVDETLNTSSSVTSQARFQRWVKLGTISYGDDFDSFPINTDAKWIQVKGWLLWTGKNELEGFDITHQPSQKAE